MAITVNIRTAYQDVLVPVRVVAIVGPDEGSSYHCCCS